MKKILCAFALLVPALAAAAPVQQSIVPGDYWRMQARNAPANTLNFMYDDTFPAADSILIAHYNGTNMINKISTFGAGINFNSTSKVISVANLPTSAITWPGSSSQYMVADGTVASFPTAVSSFTNDAGYLISSALTPYLQSSTAASTYALQTTTVNGQPLSSNVIITKSDVGLGNVDNTADSAKTFAASQITSGTKTSTFISDFNTAASTAAPVQSVAGKTGTVTLVKGDVGLGNVDNTSDANKPISTATQTALNGKFATPGGNSSQYLDGAGTPRAFPSVPGAVAVGTPNSRSLSLATAYQCTDNTKPCVVTISATCPINLTLLSTQTCAGGVWIGSTNGVASGTGTNIAPIQRQGGGILNLQTNDIETKTVTIPVGWYFAVRQTSNSAGSPSAITISAAFDQSISN